MHRSLARNAVRVLGTAAVLLALAACGKSGDGADPAPCDPACAPRQHCDAGTCVCDEGFVDCDGFFENGCEPEATCGCAYEGDAAFCERRGATCGAIAGDDNCGNRRVARCGSCPDGLACGAHEPNACGDGTCRPESMEAICQAEGWLCGVGVGADRCGTELQLDCGTCAEGLKCNARHECVDAGQDAYQPCRYQEDCTPGLECLLVTDTYAICAPVCTRSSDCPFGQRCAIPAGSTEGLCGTWRKQGESCVFPHEGADFCWDDESAAPLLCIDRRCRYVCTMQDAFLNEACPDGMSCSTELVYSEDYERWVAFCALGQQ